MHISALPLISSALMPSRCVPQLQEPITLGVHPLFVPLVLTATATLHYEVRGNVDMPHSGRSSLEMAVSLRHLKRHADGSRLVQMRIEPGAVLRDKWGAAHSVLGQLDEPLLFLQAADGRIPTVYHSQTEDEQALWMKRLLASYIQIVRDPAHRRSWYNTMERDSGGEVAANYTHRRSLFGQDVYRKQMRWHPSRRSPKQLTVSSTVLATFDRGSNWMRSMTSELRLTATSGGEISTDGLEFLPTEPARLTWVRTGRRGSRSLQGMDDDDGEDEVEAMMEGLVASELEHVAEPEPIARLRHRYGRLPALMSEAVGDNSIRGVQLACDSDAAHHHVSKLVACAAEEQPSQRRGKCATQLGDVSASCNELRAATAVERELLSTDGCSVSGRCTGLFNALEAIGTVDAQAAFARYIDHGGHVVGIDLSVALTSFEAPTQVLLEALLRRLLREDDEALEGRTVMPVAGAARGSHVTSARCTTLLEDDSPFYLAVASVASAASAHGYSSHAREVLALVKACLSHSLDVDAHWDALHNTTHHEAEQLWERLDPGTQHDWVRHSSHLSRRALQWAHHTGHYDALVEHGKVTLHRAQAQRHPAFNPGGESISHDRVVTALRAVQNGGVREAVPMVHACLAHRADPIIVAAAGTLAALDDVGAEGPLLPLLSRTYGKCSDDDDSPYVSERILRALKDTSGHVRDDTISEAVRLLLRHPTPQLAAEGGSAVLHCAKDCVQHCNPFEALGHCKQRCKRCCTPQVHAYNHMRQLLRRAAEQNAHGSLRTALRRHLPHAHPTHHRWAAHAASHVASDALIPPPGRRLYGFDDFLADAKEFFGEAEDFREKAQSYLDVYLNKIDQIADALDMVSLTFIDLVLQHKSVKFDKFWGKMDLLGSFGGAGGYGEVVVKNSAWLRVGLFGGGFGLELSNKVNFGLDVLKVRLPQLLVTPPLTLSSLF